MAGGRRNGSGGERRGTGVSSDPSASKGNRPGGCIDQCRGINCADFVCWQRIEKDMHTEAVNWGPATYADPLSVDIRNVKTARSQARAGRGNPQHRQRHRVGQYFSRRSTGSHERHSVLDLNRARAPLTMSWAAYGIGSVNDGLGWWRRAVGYKRSHDSRWQRDHRDGGEDGARPIVDIGAHQNIKSQSGSGDGRRDVPGFQRRRHRCRER